MSKIETLESAVLSNTRDLTFKQRLVLAFVAGAPAFTFALIVGALLALIYFFALMVEWWYLKKIDIVRAHNAYMQKLEAEENY